MLQRGEKRAAGRTIKPKILLKTFLLFAIVAFIQNIVAGSNCTRLYT
jgi:hypothetical protein